MMYRLHARLGKLEEAQMAWVRHATDAEFEARFGTPRLMAFINRQPDEDINRLASGDYATAQRLWKDYLAWVEAQEC